MKSLSRWLLWKAAVYLVLPGAVLLGAYGLWMKNRLDAKLSPHHLTKYSSSYSLLRPSESRVETSLPYVLRALVKRQDGGNYLPAPDGRLVTFVYDWSPAGNEWREVVPSPEALLQSVKLQRFELFTPGQLIDSLTDQDVQAREVASSLLVLRTGQDFGYRFDRSPPSQGEAIRKWRSWWEANKVEWGTKKVLDGLKEVLKK
jgi:hypothetical protein